MGFFSNLWEGIQDTGEAIGGMFSGDFWNPSTPGTVGAVNSGNDKVQGPGGTAKPQPGAVHGPPAPEHLTKWAKDPYNYNYFMTLSKEKWEASYDWLMKKLQLDYSQGRFTFAQYTAIMGRVGKMDLYSAKTPTVTDVAASAAGVDLGGMGNMLVIGLVVVFVAKILR